MSARGAEEYIDSCGEYTHSYERNKLVQDWADKDRVAQKVVQDFTKRAGELKGKTLLDAGFGNGAFVIAFAKAGAQVSGTEVNQVLRDIAVDRVQEQGLPADLRVYDGHTLPFANETFDYVYSTSVLEHVSDAREFMHEVNRVLKSGGRMYLSFPNRFAPKETHTGIWFLSYLPRSVAAWVLRVVFKRDSITELNLHFLSYFSLKRALKGTSLVVVPEPGARTVTRRFVKHVLGIFGLHPSVMLKTIMVILEKR